MKPREYRREEFRDDSRGVTTLCTGIVFGLAIGIAGTLIWQWVFW